MDILLREVSRGCVRMFISSLQALSPFNVEAVTQHTYSVNGRSPDTMTFIDVVCNLSTVGKLEQYGQLR